MSSPDSNNQDESREAEAGAREGSDPIEALVTPAQFLQALTALVDSLNSQRGASETRDAQIEARLSSLETATEGMTRLLRNALARPADPGSAAEPVSRQVLQMERSMLWSRESLFDGPQYPRLPRPSIIGRGLYDLQHEAASVYEGSKPADIYTKISDRGRHHLSETASRYVTRYRAGETSDASGKMGIHLKPRFEALAKLTDRRPYAEQTGERRYLTGHGIAIFTDWPNWDALDDDLTGYGPSTSGPAPPAGGTGTT